MMIIWKFNLEMRFEISEAATFCQRLSFTKSVESQTHTDPLFNSCSSVSIGYPNLTHYPKIVVYQTQFSSENPEKAPCSYQGFRAFFLTFWNCSFVAILILLLVWFLFLVLVIYAKLTLENKKNGDMFCLFQL